MFRNMDQKKLKKVLGIIALVIGVLWMICDEMKGVEKAEDWHGLNSAVEFVKNGYMDQDKVKPATVNREIAMVYNMLSRSVEYDILTFHPLKGLKPLKEDNRRDVSNITPEIISSLVRALREPFAGIVEFAVLTGFRLENGLGLTIAQIVFHDLKPTGEVRHIVKGGKYRTDHLGKLAVALLKRVIGNRKEGYVFINPSTGTRYKSIHKTFDRAVRSIGLSVNGTKLRIHDLRHVFATWLHMAGVSLDSLRPLLGHRHRSTTDRYVSIDRLAIGKVLKAMPSIGEEDEQEKMASIIY